jgi:hypothetical protein
LHDPIKRLIDELQENASMPPGSSFFVVLDEAQLCADTYMGAFYSEKETGPEESRSVLREIFTSWDYFALCLTVIFWDRVLPYQDNAITSKLDGNNT